MALISVRLIFSSCWFCIYGLACKKTTLPDAAGGNADLAIVRYTPAKWYMGADLSSVTMLLDQGATYRDPYGSITDPYSFFASSGCNIVRLRLFHTPESVNGYNKQGYCGLKDVKRAIANCRKYNMKIWLDIHYSDTWADPGAQSVPYAWRDIKEPAVLLDSVKNYTKMVMSSLQADSLLPDVVQFGNEISNGMLFPLGKINNNDFSVLKKILSVSIAVCRQFETEQHPIKIAMHPGKVEDAGWWFSELTNQQPALPFSFDIMAVSYYERYTSVRIESLIDSLIRLKNQYGKDVVIAETGFQWSVASPDGVAYYIPKNINGFTTTGNGQLAFYSFLTGKLFNAGGRGILAWEPAWIASSKSGFGECTSAFFDFKGYPLPVFKYMTSKY